MSGGSQQSSPSNLLKHNWRHVQSLQWTPIPFQIKAWLWKALPDQAPEFLWPLLPQSSPSLPLPIWTSLQFLEHPVMPLPEGLCSRGSPCPDSPSTFCAGPCPPCFNLPFLYLLSFCYGIYSLWIHPTLTCSFLLSFSLSQNVNFKGKGSLSVLSTDVFQTTETAFSIYLAIKHLLVSL